MIGVFLSGQGDLPERCEQLSSVTEHAVSSRRTYTKYGFAGNFRPFAKIAGSSASVG
jgi:hypothetical protein